MTRKFFINKVTISVLTEDEPLRDNIDIADLAYAIDDGPAVGGPMVIESTPVTAKAAADKLYEFHSDPSFFRLDDDGNDLETT